jgi:hypothetical protein
MPTARVVEEDLSCVKSPRRMGARCGVSRLAYRAKGLDVMKTGSRCRLAGFA